MALAKWKIIFTSYFIALWLYAVFLCVISVREAWRDGYGRISELARTTVFIPVAPAVPLLGLPLLACLKAKALSPQAVLLFSCSLMLLATTTAFMTVTMAITEKAAMTGLDERLRAELQSDYGHETTNNKDSLVFTQSMDYAQYTFGCCGLRDDDDYKLTKWYSTGASHGPPREVPPSCCVPEKVGTLSNISHSGSPISVVSRVFYNMLEEGWQKPQPKHASLCQSADPVQHASARYKAGCLQHIKNWLYGQSALALLIGGSLVFLQLIGIFLSLVLRGLMIAEVDEARDENNHNGNGDPNAH